jgi:uncharacterized protein
LAAVLVLLPPSESKAPSRPGPPVDLAGLSFPALTATRVAVLDALTELAAGPDEDVARVLGLSSRQAGELARNRRLRTAGALPAAEVYTGVLYDALGLPTLGRAARVRADHTVLVASALWGLVGPADRIPPYRLAIGVRLPGVGPLARHWQAPLTRLLPAVTKDRLVLDLRSSPYAAAWRPRDAGLVVTARVLLASTRRTVSHFNKATKGRVTRALLTSGAEPATPKDLAVLLADLGFTAELTKPGGPGRPWLLDLLVDQV